MPNSDAMGFQSFIKSTSGILFVFDTGMFETKDVSIRDGKIKPMARSKFPSAKVMISGLMIEV